MQKFSDSLLYTFVLWAKSIPLKAFKDRIVSCEYYSITEKKTLKILAQLRPLILN